MKAIRRMKQGLADAATVHDAEAPMESLREEEEDKAADFMLEMENENLNRQDAKSAKENPHGCL